VIRTALDSDNLADFTTNVDFILTYSDLVTDAPAFEARYQHQQVVYIDRGTGDPGNKATIIDIEHGAYSAEHAPGWFDAKTRARLSYLTYYCSRSGINSVIAALAGRHMWQWIATLDGAVAIPGYSPLRSPDLVQCLPAAMIGIHADFSLVLSDAWRPAPTPARLATAMADLGNAARATQNAAAKIAGAETVLRTVL
jgi:hypothetical protein